MSEPLTGHCLCGAVCYRVTDPKARRGFCRDCGGVLFWQPTDGRSIDIAFGTRDDTQGLKLTSHIHVAEARLTLPRDGLPHHDAGLPEDDAG